MLFDQGLLNLADVAFDALPLDAINGLLESGLTGIDLQALVDEGLLSASDFIDTTFVDIQNLLNDTALQLDELVSAGLLDAADFDPAAIITSADLILNNVATLVDLIKGGLVSVQDFTDIAIAEADLVNAGLALLVVVWITDKGKMIPSFPILKEVGAIA